jgi:glycosyltransferase involved in cell wall biosynthesis
MKILVVQDRLRSGGTERQSILLTRAFRAAGHDTRLLTFRPGGPLTPAAADLAPRALQPFDTRLDWFAPGLVRAAKMFSPDIALCMGRMANCRAGALQTALGKNNPRAAVIGTMRTGKTLPWLFRRSLRRVRHIVANSADARETLCARHAIPREKISVIHNSLVFAGPETAPETCARDSLRARLGATARTRVLLCVAMFRPEKNQRELIELAASLAARAPALDWQLWLAGEGDARPECERAVAKKNLGARIKFLGFTADPRPLYAAADVAALTSRSESLSNFLIEAHAHGLPSVAYAVGGVAECGGLVVPPGDQDAFVSALFPLLTDEPARAAAAARVVAHARELFSPERQAAAYLELFAALR